MVLKKKPKARPKIDLVGIVESMKSTEKGVKVVDRDYEEEFVPTGSIVLDEVLKLKGMPFGGRIIEVHGKEHGGKSTLLYDLIESYQKHTQMPAVIFDFEDTTRTWYLDGIGLDTSPEMLRVEVVYSVETAIKRAVQYMEAGVKLFMFDSIPRMKSMAASKDIKSGAAMKASVGAHARAISQFFDMLLPYATKHDCLFLMVNQIRARIDGSTEAANAVKYPSVTNLPYVLPGGNTVRYYPSIMLEVSPAKAYKGAKEDEFYLMEPEPVSSDTSKNWVATKIKVRVLKNKATDGGYREYHMYLRPGKGIDEWISVRELARAYDLIRNEGKKWVIGTPEDVITTYDNKPQLVKDLVIDQNMEVLERLRDQLIEIIRKDNSGKFDFEADDSVRYLTGELEEPDLDSDDDGDSISPTIIVNDDLDDDDDL